MNTAPLTDEETSVARSQGKRVAQVSAALAKR